MYKYLIALAFASLCLESCSTTTPDQTPQQEMTGTWTTEKIRVKINSLNNTDEDSVIIADASEFPEKLQIYKNVGDYNADGTFSDRYYASEDSVIVEVTGTWDISGDSVIVHQKEPVERIHVYMFKYKRGKGFFKGMVDWDGDGKKDDEFTGIASKAGDDK